MQLPSQNLVFILNSTFHCGQVKEVVQRRQADVDVLNKMAISYLVALFHETEGVGYTAENSVTNIL